MQNNIAKITKYLLFFVLCFFLSYSYVLATDYYIKNGGNDSAAGTSDGTAWATVAKVNDFAEATGFASGDTINFNRGDTWTSDETLGNDGSSIAWGTINGLTIQAYGTGDKPWLNGNTQRPISITAGPITNLTIKDIDVSGGDWLSGTTFDANIRLANVSGIVIDGVDFNGHTGATDNGPAGAIYITDYGTGNLEIENCTIQNVIGIGGTLGEWGEGVDACGMFIGSKTSGTISIHDNIVHDVESDCIQFYGAETTTNIYNNTMYNFGENALDFKGSYNTTIYNNEFYRGTYGLGGSGGGTGNVVFHDVYDFTCRNAVIRDNYFHTTDYIGLRLINGANFEVYRNYFKDCTNAIQMHTNSNVKVYNNVFDLVNGEYSAYALDAAIYATTATKTSCSVFNNTFYMGANHRYGIYSRHSGMSYLNNIFYTSLNSSGCYPLYVTDTTTPTVSNNAYYNPNHANRVYWNGTVYDSTEEADYQSAHDAGAVFSAPGITPASDIFWPTTTGAAVYQAGTDTGTSDADPGLRSDSMWTPSFSIQTQARPTPKSIGAFEWYVASPVAISGCSFSGCSIGGD